MFQAHELRKSAETSLNRFSLYLNKKDWEVFCPSINKVIKLIPDDIVMFLHTDGVSCTFLSCNGIFTENIYHIGLCFLGQHLEEIKHEQ